MARTAPAPAKAPVRRREPTRAGALAAALGVTRVARVTGLDRTGVEVACAVRPGGHVLQVTNGKGRSYRDAARGALLEAAELACAERVAAQDLVFASAAELEARGAPFVAPRELGGGAPASARLAWRSARELLAGEEVLVPAAAVHATADSGPLLGAAGVRWTTNGMGAHPSWAAALLHALLEAVERDQLARALPDGFTERDVRARRLSRGAIARAAPGAAALRARVERGGFDVQLLDAAPREGAVGLPVAAALLFDRERGPVPLTAGYACGLDEDAALTGALLEAAQSRLTDIHGAREDVRPMRERDVERLRRACERAARGERDPDPDPDRDLDPDPDRDLDLDRERDRERDRDLDRERERERDRDPLSPALSPAARGRGRRRDLDVDRRRGPSPRSLPALGRGGSAGTFSLSLAEGEGQGEGDEPTQRALRRVVRLLHRAGHRRVLALDLAPADFPVRVAKVIVPGLLLSHLL
jgi:ribosomal protein S12 methylthiotransferase accessory factor